MANGDLTWQNPTTNTDGSPFDESQFGGYTLEVDGGPSVSLPIGWKQDNSYNFSLLTLHLAEGSHSIRMRTVAKNGEVSAPTNPVTWTQPARVPNPPLAVAVATA